MPWSEWQTYEADVKNVKSPFLAIWKANQFFETWVKYHDCLYRITGWQIPGSAPYVIALPAVE
jgi:hypothetical protein